MIMNHCPVCNSSLTRPSVPAGNRNQFSCPRCGVFVLSDEVVEDLPSILGKDAAAKISHALRRAQENNSLAEFSWATIEAVVGLTLPRPREQADLLVRWIGENIPGPGERIRVEPTTNMGIIGAKTPAGFKLVVDHLFDEELITGHLDNTIGSYGDANVTLSFKGTSIYYRMIYLYNFKCVSIMK